MKTYSILAVIAIMFFSVSCEKDQIPYGKFPHGKNDNNYPARKVRYELYTNENFAGEQENIQFSLRMENANKVIYDSVLATMKIADIPDSAHRIIIEKFVPGNDASTLKVGFVYQIENVGISWHFEAFSAGETLKVVRFPFQ